MGGSHNITSASGYTFKLYPDGKWELYRKAKKVVTGTCDAKHSLMQEQISGIRSRWKEKAIRLTHMSIICWLAVIQMNSLSLQDE